MLATFDVNGAGNFRGSLGVGSATNAAIAYGDSTFLTIRGTPRPILRLVRGDDLEYIIGMENSDSKLRISPGNNSSRPADLNNGISMIPSGYVGFRQPSPLGQIHVESDGSGNPAILVNSTAGIGSGLIQIKSTQTTVSPAFEIIGDSDSDQVGAYQAFVVQTDGTIRGRFGNYHTGSDLRLKKDIAAIPDALSRVLQLRGVNFRWKDKATDGDKLQMGLIAQEVEKVFPEVVHTAEDKIKTKAVIYDKLVAAMIEAIKQQEDTIELQGRQIAELQSAVNKLRGEGGYTVERSVTRK